MGKTIRTPLDLDRMEIECAGPDVVAMARELHRQIRLRVGPVDVKSIARGLDVSEIRAEPLNNFEGALLTTLEKTTGAILVNQRSSARRRRFTVAHELCHLLHAHHRPVDHGFLCTSKDLRIRGHRQTPGWSRHKRQEWQANRFAIEVLLPEHMLSQFLEDPPCMEIILEMADEFDVSREAAARHFVEKCEEPLAMVFSQHGRMRYAVQSNEFPRLGLRRGDPVVYVANGGSQVGEPEAADPADWLRTPKGEGLTAQTLTQQKGFAMTLLALEDAEDVAPPPEFRRSTRKR